MKPNYEVMTKLELMDAYQEKFHEAFPTRMAGDALIQMRQALKTGKPFKPIYDDDKVY